MDSYRPATQDQEDAYRRAKDLLGILIGYRAAWISEEERKPEPNQEQIAKWKSEQGLYYNKATWLDVSNDAEISAIMTDYEPQRKTEAAIFATQASARNS
jgi:hypothetical protein